MSICCCPNHRDLLSIEDLKSLRVACLSTGLPKDYPLGFSRWVHDSDGAAIGEVKHLSGTTWGASTVHTSVCDVLRFFTCPYDAAMWLHAVHANEVS